MLNKMDATKHDPFSAAYFFDPVNPFYPILSAGA